MLYLIPAVLSTKQCHDYVGGARIWEELVDKHGDDFKPLRTLPRGDAYYRRETIDRVLLLAEASGTLRQSPADAPRLLARHGRRYREIPFPTATDPNHA
jgi:hypothetical protein